MNAPLQAFMQRRAMLGGYDPNLGLDMVGGPGLWAARQFGRVRRVRCGDDDLGFDDDIGADEDDDDLGEIDQEIGAASWSDEDEDAIGADPSRAVKKAKKKLKRAEKNLSEVEIKIARARLPRRKEKLKERRAKIKAEIRELKGAISRAEGRGGRADVDDDSSTQDGEMRSNGGGRFDPYSGDARAVYAGTPPGGRQIEVPLLFNNSNLFEASIAGGTAANTTAAFTADSQAFNYMILRVVGFKVNAWLQSAIALSSGASGTALSLLDPSNQLAVECQSLVPDGGLDLLANARQTINLGGSFGSASERSFDGLRSRDVIEQNGTARLTGQIRTVFSTFGAMKFAMEAALICEVVRDFKVDRYRGAA